MGFLEADAERGRDSFETFREVLELARRHNADFVLHGGDLFHDNKPTRRTMFHTMELLREFCLGDRAPDVDIVSDQVGVSGTSANARGGGPVTGRAPSRASSRHPRTSPWPTTRIRTTMSACRYLRFTAITTTRPGCVRSRRRVRGAAGCMRAPTCTGATAQNSGLCPLNLLSVANFVNYFGRSNRVDDITIEPILMRKGRTHLALYGLGSVHDERLFRTFHAGKVRLRTRSAAVRGVQQAGPRCAQVRMMVPEPGSGNWFNLFVLHQNRYAPPLRRRRNAAQVAQRFLRAAQPDGSGLGGQCEARGEELHTGKLHRSHLPFGFLGARARMPHRARAGIRAVHVRHAAGIERGDDAGAERGGAQVRWLALRRAPGCRLTGRAMRPAHRHVGMLYVHQREDGRTLFHVEKLPLRTVRPFVLGEVRLSDAVGSEQEMGRVLARKVEELIADALEAHDNAKLPLVRLKVECTGCSTLCNARRFGQQFAKRIANPDDILKYFRRGSAPGCDGDADDNDEEDLYGHYNVMRPAIAGAHMDTSEVPGAQHVEHLVRSQLKGADSLRFFCADALTDAVHRFVDKEENHEIESYVGVCAARCPSRVTHGQCRRTPLCRFAEDTITKMQQRLLARIGDEHCRMPVDEFDRFLDAQIRDARIDVADLLRQQSAAVRDGDAGDACRVMPAPQPLATAPQTPPQRPLKRRDSDESDEDFVPAIASERAASRVRSCELPLLAAPVGGAAGRPSRGAGASPQSRARSARATPRAGRGGGRRAYRPLDIQQPSNANGGASADMDSQDD